MDALGNELDFILNVENLIRFHVESMGYQTQFVWNALEIHSESSRDRVDFVLVREEVNWNSH